MGVPGPDSKTSDRVAGLSLATASILSVVVMAHHPSDFDSGIGGLVHGAMIVFVLIMSAGFVRFAALCGLERFTVLLGLVAYLAAAFANALAGMLNGFVGPALHRHQGLEGALRLSWELNQALAAGAVYATSAAFILWGAQLARRQHFERVVGIAGMLIGAGGAAMLASGALQMNVAGAFAIYGSQALFGILAGAVLARPRSA